MGRGVGEQQRLVVVSTKMGGCEACLDGGVTSGFSGKSEGDGTIAIAVSMR